MTKSSRRKGKLYLAMHIRRPSSNQDEYEVKYPGYERAEIRNFFEDLAKDGVMSVTLSPIEFAKYPYRRNLVVRYWSVGTYEGKIICVGEITRYGLPEAHICKEDIPILSDLFITIDYGKRD